MAKDLLKGRKVESGGGFMQPLELHSICDWSCR